jgi:hypothetical protein
MVKPTTRSRLLVAVSVAQLATNVTGMAVALRRRHPYDVFWMHGQADTVARDAILRGTALSAPVSNLLAQAAMTVLVARRPSPGAARALAGLGALQVPGYLGERLVRRRLRPSGWDAVESPLAAAGIGLAGALLSMASKDRAAALGLPPAPERALGWLLGGRDGRLLLVAVGAVLGAPVAALAAVAATSALSLGLRVGFLLRRPSARDMGEWS